MDNERVDFKLDLNTARPQPPEPGGRRPESGFERGAREDRIPKIKAAKDFRTVFQQYYPDHYRENGNSLCPFHDDHGPSFSIDERGGLCRGECKRPFDVIDLYERAHQISNCEAIDLLAEEIGLQGGNGQRPQPAPRAPAKSNANPPDFQARMDHLAKAPIPAVGMKYLLETRGLSKAVVEALKAQKLVGYSTTKKALAFPLFSHDRTRIVGIQYIPTDGSQKTLAKGSSMKEGYFFLDGVGQGPKELILTEGIVNACSSASVSPGVDVCALMSAGSFPEKVGKLSHPSLIAFVDNDDAGKKAIQQTIAAGHHHVRFVDLGRFPPPLNDANDLLRRGHADLIKELIQTAAPPTPDQIQKAKVAATPQPCGVMNTKIQMPDGWDAPELLNTHFPAPRWIVPGLLTQGLGIVAGRPKMGKSWLCLGLSLAVASGGYFLDDADCQVKKGGVLYLSLEDNARRLKKRLISALNGDPAPADLHIKIAWPKIDKGGLELLSEWLEDHPDTRLVIIDTLGKVWPTSKGKGADGNTYNADYDLTASIKAIADSRNICILVVHHLRKQIADDPVDQISGTTGIAGATDSIWILDRKRGDDCGTLTCVGRDFEDKALYLWFDKSRTSWVWNRGVPALALGASLTKAERQVVEALVGIGGSAGRYDVAKALGKDPRATGKLLEALVDKGVLSHEPYGPYEIMNELGATSTTCTTSPTCTTGATPESGQSGPSHGPLFSPANQGSEPRFGKVAQVALSAHVPQKTVSPFNPNDLPAWARGESNTEESE